MPTAFGPMGPNFTTLRPAYDPDASGGVDTWFKNCSVAGAKDGTFVTADFFNVIVANIRQLVKTGQITLDGTNDLMVTQAVQAICAALINQALAGLGGGGGGAVTYSASQGAKLSDVSAGLKDIRWDIPGLSTQDTLGITDLIGYQSLADNLPRKTSLSNFVAFVIGRISASSGSAALLNTKSCYLTEYRDQTVSPRNFSSTGTWYNRFLNNIESQITGATLNISTGAIYLPAGTYRMAARASASRSGLNQARIAQADGTVLRLGGTSDSYIGQGSGLSGTTNDSLILEFRKTFTVGTTVYLQHCAFGAAISAGTMGDESQNFTQFNDAQFNIFLEAGVQ